MEAAFHNAQSDLYMPNSVHGGIIKGARKLSREASPPQDNVRQEPIGEITLHANEIRIEVGGAQRGFYARHPSKVSIAAPQRSLPQRGLL